MGFFKKWGSVILLLLAAGSIAGIFVSDLQNTQTSAIGVFLVIAFLSLIALLALGGVFLMYAWNYRCKSCKKWFAMQKGTTEFAGTQNAKLEVETGVTRSEYDGKVTQRHFSKVDHTRDVYKINYICKYCGNKDFDSKFGKFRMS